MVDGHANRRAMRRKDYVSVGKRGSPRASRLAGSRLSAILAPFGESGCESGGIGRRTGFRFQRGSPWGFESPLSHHRIRQLARIRRACKRVWKRSASSNAGSRCAVPLAQIESEVQKRLARLAKNVQGPRLPAGQGADEDGRAAVRPAGALRRHHRHRAVELQRRDPRAEPARRRLSADRAEAEARARRTSSSSRPCSRSIPRSSSATSPTVTIERPVAEVGADDVDHTIEMLRKQRARYETRRARRGETGDRVDRRLHRHASTASSFAGGQAKDFAIVLGEGRMLPEFEAAVTGMTRGREQDLSAHLSRPIITARMSPESTRSSR